MLLLGSLLGLELIGKVPPTLTPDGASTISSITVLASLTLIAAQGNPGC